MDLPHGPFGFNVSLMIVDKGQLQRIHSGDTIVHVQGEAAAIDDFKDYFSRSRGVRRGYFMFQNSGRRPLEYACKPLMSGL